VGGESCLERSIVHDHVIHLEHVDFVRCQPEDEATASEVLTGADVDLAREQVAQMIVDGGIVLDVDLRRQSQVAPVLHQPRRIILTERHCSNRTIRRLGPRNRAT